LLVELETVCAHAAARAGSEWVVTGNIVAARFDHIAARPASGGLMNGYGSRTLTSTRMFVIANMTRRPDGEVARPRSN